MSERKLVTVQTVTDVQPIAGADNIEQAQVMGWTVVVKRGEFKPGDPCVFFEIDSVLPDGPAWSEFMRPRGFRLRTVRLRGVLSQGLALPVSILDDSGELSSDLSARLGVTKYEPELPNTLEIEGPFPARVPKTDEIRLQSCLGVLDELRGREFCISTKLDGQSATYVTTEEGVREGLTVASRNWALKPSENNAWRMARNYDLDQLPLDMAIQGEICGPGVRKNRLDLSHVDLFVFNVYDIRRGAYLNYDEFMMFVAEHGLRHVPIESEVWSGDLVGFDYSLEAWLERAKGFYLGTKNRKEGIVVRPLVETRSATLGGRLSFKVLNNEFLLKDEA
jgi:RNA ligase (TIGR02306 family)